MRNNPNPRDGSDDALPDMAAAGASDLSESTPEEGIPELPAPEPVHRWLDGESVSDADLHAPDAERHVKFWAKVNEETDRRRRLKTPRGLDAIIMDKLQPPTEKGD
jgi:hypothetical protein